MQTVELSELNLIEGGNLWNGMVCGLGLVLLGGMAASVVSTGGIAGAVAIASGGSSALYIVVGTAAACSSL